MRLLAAGCWLLLERMLPEQARVCPWSFRLERGWRGSAGHSFTGLRAQPYAAQRPTTAAVPGLNGHGSATPSRGAGVKRPVSRCPVVPSALPASYILVASPTGDNMRIAACTNNSPRTKLRRCSTPRRLSAPHWALMLTSSAPLDTKGSLANLARQPVKRAARLSAHSSQHVAHNFCDLPFQLSPISLSLAWQHGRVTSAAAVAAAAIVRLSALNGDPISCEDGVLALVDFVVLDGVLSCLSWRQTRHHSHSGNHTTTSHIVTLLISISNSLVWKTYTIAWSRRANVPLVTDKSPQCCLQVLLTQSESRS
jgi:hypothetical protein